VRRLGAFCRYGTTLPARLSERAILIARRWKADYESSIHARRSAQGRAASKNRKPRALI
jgi:hypothetical protein